MLEKIYRRYKYQTGRPLPKLEEDGKSWLRRPKLYKGVVELYKKKKKYVLTVRGSSGCIMYTRPTNSLHLV